MEIRGHLEGFDLEQGRIDIVTCPEWPPQRFRIHFADPSAIHGLGVFQMLRVEADEVGDRLVGRWVTPAG